ncbi:MAG: hypothetical protein ACR2L2_06335 [Acidobacteriota bacterium]
MPGKNRFWTGRHPTLVGLAGFQYLAAKVTERKDQGRDLWEPFEVDGTPDNILPYVSEFIFPKTGTPVEERYVLAYRLSKRFLQREIPDQGKTVLSGRAEGVRWKFPVEFGEVHLFFFRSGIGILMFRVTLRNGITTIGETRSEHNVETQRPLGLDELIVFNWLFSRCRRQLRRHYEQVGEPESRDDGGAIADDRNWERRATYFRSFWPKREPKEKLWHLDELTDGLLEPIVGRKEETWKAVDDTRLLGYTFALLERRNKQGELVAIPYSEIRQPLFWLRQYSNKSHLPASSDLRLRGNPEILQTYKNIYFGMSSEGSAVLAWHLGDPFIKNQLRDKIEHNYFIPFLIAVHQRLATMHLAELIGQSSYLRHSEKPTDRKLAAEIRRLRTRVFEFIICCWFADVSSSRVYTRVYQAWQRVFEAGALLEEVKNEVAELDDYLERVEMKGQTTTINILTLLMLPVTLWMSFWGMNFSQFQDLSFWWWPVRVSAAAVVVGFGGWFWWSMRSR